MQLKTKVIITAVIMLICAALVIFFLSADNKPAVSIVSIIAVLMILRLFTHKSGRKRYAPDVLMRYIEKEHERILVSLEESGRRCDHSLESLRDADGFIDEIKQNRKLPSRILGIMYLLSEYIQAKPYARLSEASGISTTA